MAWTKKFPTIRNICDMALWLPLLTTGLDGEEDRESWRRRRGGGGGHRDSETGPG